MDMLKNEMKYLLKNPIFYLGLFVVVCVIAFNVGPYLDLYEHVGKTKQNKYGDFGLVDGYIPTPKDEQKEQVINKIYDSLLEDYHVSSEEARNVLQKLKSLNSQAEIEEYLTGNYEMPGVSNVFEEYSSKKATHNEMEGYLKKIFKKETYTESLSYKYIDFLGIGLIYFSVLVFMFVFARDMKKDIYCLVHTKSISSFSYITTKLFAGLIPLYAFAVVATVVFDIIANRVAVINGFTCEWLSVWIKLLLLVFPNVFMMGTFFIFITMVFKNILPTIPALLIYATYSNMGRVLEDGYSYVPNPLAIVVRFPNALTNNYIPVWVVVNQIILIVLAVGLLFVSIRLWEKRKML